MRTEICRGLGDRELRIDLIGNPQGFGAKRRSFRRALLWLSVQRNKAPRLLNGLRLIERYKPPGLLGEWNKTTVRFFGERHKPARRLNGLRLIKRYEGHGAYR